MLKKKKKTVAKPDFLTLDDVDVKGKRVLVRMDLNVPMQGGRVSDNTRVVRLLPTINELLKKKAKVIILSHLGRPNGAYVTDLTLAPLVDAMAEVLPGVRIKFGVDCVGPEAKAAVANVRDGEIMIMENLRFHEGEEKNDKKFAKELAELGDIYVNDAFSCSHRAHASVVGINAYLPHVAGRLMEEELAKIKAFFETPSAPFTAIVGGSKISTKLALLENLIQKVDHLIIGGAMANTFLKAQGHDIGQSLIEKDLVKTAKHILAYAQKIGCEILLPTDVFYTSATKASGTAKVDAIPSHGMVVDFGLDTINRFTQCLAKSKTVLWNGPLGMFETRTFDAATVMMAREIARLTEAKKIKSIAGGGDTVAALALTKLTGSFSYVSTAGGAFLEWMEGKTLPGVAALKP